MKVQNTGGWYNKTDNVNGVKSTDGTKESFSKLLNGHITAASAGDMVAVRTGRTVLRTLNSVNNDGIRNLIKDAFTDINKDILAEIDIMLDEEKGESIDMHSIDQLLDLCTDSTLLQ